MSFLDGGDLLFSPEPLPDLLLHVLCEVRTLGLLDLFLRPFYKLFSPLDNIDNTVKGIYRVFKIVKMGSRRFA